MTGFLWVTDKTPLRVGNEACDVCEMAISYVQSLLEKNSTQEEIVHVVEKVCNYLSGDMATQVCTTFLYTRIIANVS